MKRFIVLLFVIIGFSMVNAQTFKKVKVTMSNGMTIKGSSASITNDILYMKTNNIMAEYQLSDVSMIMAKQGKASKWAIGCGGGCLGICMISGIASGAEGIEEAGTTVGGYIAGSLIWTGFSVGVGYLIGTLLDDYEIVYNKNFSAIKDKVDLSFSPLKFQSNGPLYKMVTLSYKF